MHVNFLKKVLGLALTMLALDANISKVRGQLIVHGSIRRNTQCLMKKPCKMLMSK